VPCRLAWSPHQYRVDFRKRAHKRTTSLREQYRGRVFCAITRKYGYTRLESELAHSINGYDRAEQRNGAVEHRMHPPARIPYFTGFVLAYHAYCNSARYNAGNSRVSASEQREHGSGKRFPLDFKTRRHARNLSVTRYHVTFAHRTPELPVQ